jgi:glyoxylase-like metal-dependent hydrolase (beta-lactamase superfamily II)
MLRILLAAAFLFTAAPANAAGPAAWSADLEAVRHVGEMVPGAKPTHVNVVKFAESRRTKNFSIKGAPKEPSIQARTAYQVVYDAGTVMIDSGMDIQVHRFFGRGRVEPYFADKEKEVNAALMRANAIVMTHEHGDHIAGVIDTPMMPELAPKTVLTRTQVATLEHNPQMPEIKLTPEQASHFIVIDYDKYYPFAPGMVLIKAPGHTPGSQMIYVRLQSGREYIFAGDVAWHMDGVRTMTGKDAPWVKENTQEIAAELKWLNGIYRTEKNVVIVISHDEDQRLQYVKAGLLGDHFE